MRISVFTDGSSSPQLFDLPSVPKMKVRDLKRRIAEKTGLVPSEQELFFEGWKELTDTTVLSGEQLTLELRTPLTKHHKVGKKANRMAVESMPSLQELAEECEASLPQSQDGSEALSASPRVTRKNLTCVEVALDEPQAFGNAQVLPFDKSSAIFQLYRRAQGTLCSLSMREAVKLPAGVAREPWIAAQVLSIYDAVGHLAAALGSVCTEATCPKMSAGPRWHFEWADDENPVPRQVPANEYVRLLLELAFRTLSDPTVIPQDGGEFSEKFEGSIRRLLKRFLRVYMHAYASHMEQVAQHGAFMHLNSSFKRFLFFVREFDLVDASEFAPIQKIVATYDAEDRKIPRGREVAPCCKPVVGQLKAGAAKDRDVPGGEEVGTSALQQVWAAHPVHGDRQAAMAVAETLRMPRGHSFEQWMARCLGRVLKGVRSVKGLLEDSVSCSLECCCGRSTQELEKHLSPAAGGSPPAMLSAPEYASLWIDWAQAQLRAGVASQKGLQRDEARLLLRLAFPVYAHAYAAHFEALEERGVAVILNGHFQHFLLLGQAFRLLRGEDFAPFGPLAERLALDLFAKLPRGAATCPAGHALERHEVGFDFGAVCDVCEEELGGGAAVYDCERWDFAICEACRATSPWLGEANLQSQRQPHELPHHDSSYPESPLPASAPLLRLHRRAAAAAAAAESGGRCHTWACAQPPDAVGQGAWAAACLLGTLRDLAEQEMLLSPVCTSKSCPTMHVDGAAYDWPGAGQDAPRRVSAREHLRLALGAARATLGQEAFAAAGLDWELDGELREELRALARHFLRAYAHAWISHSLEMERRGFKELFERSLRKYLRLLRDFQLLGQADSQPLLALARKSGR